MKANNAYIALIGPPASGKGTLRGELADRLGLPCIVPGDIYKRLREEDSELGRDVKEALKDGGLCPNWMTNNIVLREAIAKHDGGAQAAIFDGYPRTMAQFHVLSGLYPLGMVIVLEQPFEVLRTRSLNRYECPRCHSICSKADARFQCGCDTDESERIPRWDDNAEMIAKRYQTYLRETYPIVQHLDEGASKLCLLYKKYDRDLDDNQIQELCDEISARLRGQ